MSARIRRFGGGSAVTNESVFRHNKNVCERLYRGLSVFLIEQVQKEGTYLLWHAPSVG